jgi:FAD/FMN-containing dehydrogenase
MNAPEAIGDLRKRLSGQVIEPGEAAYDEARALFNAMHDKRPAVIVRCASAADVSAAVQFGRQRGLPIAVRSGGHSVAGLSACDGGILIDLGRLKQIESAASRPAVVTAGRRRSTG